MRALFGAAALAALAYAGILAALFLLQSRLIFFPEIGREDATTPRDAGFAYEELRLATADGETLHAWYVPAPEARGVALLFQGNAGSIAQRVAWLPLLAALRLDALLVEYRGYGRSSGTPSEAGLRHDADAAWRHLTEVRGRRPEQVVVFGESLGGAVAAGLAARQRPGALVLMASFTSLADLGAELYPWLPVRPLLRFRFDTRAALAQVRCPVFIAHSRDDEIVPFLHAEALHAVAPQPKALLAMRGGHNEGVVYAEESWRQALAKFLEAHWWAAHAVSGPSPR
jgi:hypothetical protein